MNNIINSIMENLPVLILIIPLYLLMQKTLSAVNNFSNAWYANAKANRSTDNTIPSELKIQAHERLTLFIERIKPESLLLRVNEAGISNAQLQLLLIGEIRQEFEHNLTQQLYVNESAWNACQNAKDNMVSIINSAATNINPEANSIELANNILKLYIANQDSSKKALQLLRLGLQ